MLVIILIINIDFYRNFYNTPGMDWCGGAVRLSVHKRS